MVQRAMVVNHRVYKEEQMKLRMYLFIKWNEFGAWLFGIKTESAILVEDNK